MNRTRKSDTPSNALSMMWRQEHHRIAPILNGSTRTGLCAPRELLPDFLCHELGVTDTHADCEYGVCGAYAVRVDDVASCFCLMLAVQAGGRVVDTVEDFVTHKGLSDLQGISRRYHAL